MQPRRFLARLFGPARALQLLLLVCLAISMVAPASAQTQPAAPPGAAAASAAARLQLVEVFVREGACAAVWPDWWAYKREAYDAIRENAAYLQAAGACVAMHSDSGISGQRLNIEAAKSVAAGARAGVLIAPEQAVAWFTSNPARMLGLEDRIGTLEPGKIADLVLWSGNPFSIYTHADQVYVDGALAFDRKDPARQPRSDFELGQPSLVPRP